MCTCFYDCQWNANYARVQERSVDERHFNYVNEAQGKRQKCQERNEDKRGGNEENCCVFWREQQHSPLSVYSAVHLRNKKKLQVIAASSVRSGRAITHRKEVRDIRVMQMTEASHTLRQSFSVILWGSLSPGVYSSLVALLLICSIYFMYSDTAGCYGVKVGDLL